MNNETNINAAETLSEYIARLNAGSDCKLTTDLSHWADYGIHSAAQLGDYLDMECANNVFKDENGFRPRFENVGEARAYLDQVAIATEREEIAAATPEDFIKDVWGV